MRSILVAVCLAAVANTSGQVSFLRGISSAFNLNASAVAPNGNILLCGTAGSFPSSEGVVLCTDPAGNVLWCHSSEGTGPNWNGPGLVDYPQIAYTEIAWAAGYICVNGYAVYELNGNGYGAFVTVTLDSAGNMVEAKSVAAIHPHAPRSVMPYGATDVLRANSTQGLFGGSFLLSRGPTFPTSNTFDSRTYAFPVNGSYSGGLYDMTTLPNGGAAAVGGGGMYEYVVALFNDSLVELWNTTFTTPGLISPLGHIASTPDGGVVVGLAQVTATAGNEPVHLYRYSSTGTLLWAKAFTWPADARLTGMHVRNNDKIVVAGGLWTDGPADSAQVWLMQLDAAGTVEWIERYGGLGGIIKPLDFHVAPSGHEYILTAQESQHGHLIMRVDSLGQIGPCSAQGTLPTSTTVVHGAAPAVAQYLWGSGVGGDWVPVTTPLTATNTFGCFDADGVNLATGHLFHDADQDGVYDVAEIPFPWWPVSVAPMNGTLFTTNSGSYLLATPFDAAYSISAPPSAPWWTLTAGSAGYNPTFTATDSLFEDLDFGYAVAFDTTVLAGSFASAATGCVNSIHQTIAVQNQGTTTPQGVIAYTFDTLLVVLNASPAPDSIVGNTCYWQFDSLPFFGNWAAEVEVIGGLSGDTLSATVLVQADDGFGNLSVVDQVDWQSIVACAYEPNNKQVSPSGFIPPDQDWLTYTVRFQNTGTDTATTVVIEDQLSQHLQWNTLQVLSASHPLTGLSIGQLGKAMFTFDAILLPDSNTNGPASHGFIIYRVAPQQGLAHLTAIPNTASILFDQNPAVITNTVETIVVDCATGTQPATWVGSMGNVLIVGIGDTLVHTYQWYFDGFAIPGANGTFQGGGQLYYTALDSGTYTVAFTDPYGCVVTSFPFIVTEVQEDVLPQLRVLPVPFTTTATLFSTVPLDARSSIELIDLHGRVVSTLQGNGTRAVTIERGDLQSGLYMVRVMDAQGQRSAVRVVVQ